MSFFLCNTLHCVFCLLVILLILSPIVSTTSTTIQTTTLTQTTTTTTTCFPVTVSLSCDSVRLHSSVFKFLPVFPFYSYHSLTFTMPVITRSMSRWRVSHGESDFIDSSSRPFENNMTSAAPSSLSLDHHSSSSLLLPDDLTLDFETDFEISYEPSLEFSNLCLPCSITPFSSHNFQMEPDCNENSLAMKAEPDPPDPSAAGQDELMKMLLAISSQMMVNTQNLQEQIVKNAKDVQDQLTQTDLKFQTEINHLNQEHELFKQEIQNELLSLSTNGTPTSVPTVSPAPSLVSLSLPAVMMSSLHAPSSTGTVPSTSTPSSSPQDFQAQMLHMLNDTFSKLSTVLMESKNDAKSEWPKFSGGISKFREWYLAIMAQLSLPPWNPLYDPIKNDIVDSTSNSSLNGKLYAKLLICLEGQAMKNMISRKHLRANGLLLLQELHHMYKLENVPEVIAAKTAEFWSKWKQSNFETVDSYYNCFHALFDEINDHKESITKADAIRHFIFTLGADFASIQNNFHIDNLPPSWQTDDWPKLLILCQDYYNSLHPNGPPAKKDLNHGDSPFTSRQDRLDHQKKIRLWFMNPGKYKNELVAEQQKHLGKCIYHLCDNHSTDNCNIKRECDKNLGNKQSSPPTATAGQLRHITEECFEDAVDNDACDDVDEDICKNTNEESLQYFLRVSKHCLRLVKNSKVLPRHSMKFPIIADRGVNFHMFCDHRFFKSIKPLSGKVILGDGKTSFDIQGIGTIQLKFGSDILTVENVRYVPTLAESINSLFVHIQCPGHALNSSFQDGMTIIFPTFQTKAILGHDDIYLNATPFNVPSISMDPESVLSSSSSTSAPSNFCRHVTQFQDEVSSEVKKVDNLLVRLCQYYNDVKTRRQLDMEIPEGF
jgi:hypothetical protein